MLPKFFTCASIATSWLAMLTCWLSVAAAETEFAPEAVEFFEKRVRPILVARCHECHSGAEVKGGLRLDSRAGVLAGGDTGAAIVAGKPDESLLVDAIRYGDVYQMPPNSRLPAEEVTVLEEWIRKGLPWGAEAAATPTPTTAEFDLAARARHWSFQPLADAPPPEVRDAGWVKTPVDRFLLARLEAADMKPAPAADRSTLLRRATFDLTGLPPSAKEIEAFLADRSPRAFEHVVERLLASPRYGERWARHWLDLVRFAETQGHEFDFEIAGAYHYRDYVIRSLNADVPYNQFVVEHIAGDLLDPPRRNRLAGTNESIIATGWYFFGEAVHSPVDIRADEATRVDNQIDVFSKAFLGLTVSCARCHDHKFDAISTKDYYALAGYLQSSRYQQGYIDAPETQLAQREQLRLLQQERSTAARQYLHDAVAPQLARLAETLRCTHVAAITDAPRTQPDHLLHAWTRLSNLPDASTEAFVREKVELLGSITAGGGNARTADTQPVDFGGQGFAAWTATGTAFESNPGEALRWDFASRSARLPGRLLTAQTAHSGLVSPRLRGVLRSPTFEITGPKLWYRLYGSGGRVRLILDGFQLIRNPIYGGLELAPQGTDPQWLPQDLSKWVGHRAYIELVDDGDGYIALEQIAFADQQPQHATPNPLIVKMLDDPTLVTPQLLAASYQRTFKQVLDDWLAETPGEPDEASARAEILEWIVHHLPPDPEGTRAAETHFHEKMAAIDRRQQVIEQKLAAPRTAPAIADGTAENERVFIRGNHKTPGDEVPRRFLEVLGGVHHEALPGGSGRLELAQQLVSPDCPLAPRVIVNRLWHHHFGAGLVRSPDDFGVMGQLPTHPELLDYLATELIRNGWSLKYIHRLIVLSSAYQMASHVDPVADRVDPENKLWHRAMVRRLEAESVRDAVLCVSGSLNETMFGPSVMPHLTEFMAGRGRPDKSGPLDGDGRRSIYLMVRRNFLSPMFLAFDYPTPFTTIGRRGTSNVPAQALTMMNNPFVLEQAGHWADRVLALPVESADERIRTMYVDAFGRPPTATELTAAMSFVQAADERQTWADLAHVLFNVKEFLYIP